MYGLLVLLRGRHAPPPLHSPMRSAQEESSPQMTVQLDVSWLGPAPCITHNSWGLAVRPQFIVLSVTGLNSRACTFRRGTASAGKHVEQAATPVCQRALQQTGGHAVPHLPQVGFAGHVLLRPDLLQEELAAAQDCARRQYVRAGSGVAARVDAATEGV